VTALRDSPVVIVTVLWIAAVAFLVGTRFEGLPAADTEAAFALPTQMAFGRSVDLVTGAIREESDDFDLGVTVAFTAHLEDPVGVEVVQLELARLRSDGALDPDPLWGREPFEVDPERPFVVGELPADRLEVFGRGTYRLRIFRENHEWLAIGVFQVEAVAPEATTHFVRSRSVLVDAGTHVGYRFNEDGEVIGETSAALHEAVTLRSNRRAVFGGLSHVLILDGVWRGYWLPESDSVRLSDE
jgi:hypothetical protein